MSAIEMKLFHSGAFHEGVGRRSVLRPFDGSEVGSVHLAGPEQIEAALASAAAAAPALRETPAHQRAAWLDGIRQGIAARRERFVELIVAEGGKPRRFAEGEVARCLTTFSFAAEEARRIGGEVLPFDAVPTGEGRLGIVRRFPVGPVTAITPFNFPLNLVAHKLAPALAAGCPVLLKPADETPLCAGLLAEIYAEVGVLPGALAVLPCEVKDAAPLTADERVRLLSFTGSATVGWMLKGLAGKKPALLELGGNAAVIVHEDADLEQAVERCAFGAFAHAGQVCISVQRIYVHAAVHDRFLEALVERTKALKCGDPSDPEVVVGPLRADRDADRILEWVRDAEAAGAVRHCGGEREGRVITPMVFTGVDPSARLSCEEVFGPVVVVHRYEDWEEALARVDDSPFGLQAGVFTRDVGRVMEAHRKLEVGAVIHDDVPTYRIDPMPYGGVKGSGLGREGLRYAIEAMTEPRLLVLRG
ncbi:MAG: aldehyde dehydrogenase family protein [Deltaproteobacteria bacterium]|nr:aldehyde dehydrogenase family protein [Deltaproteobacteria bacterium]